MLNDDFLQYWLGAYVHLDAATWGEEEENPVNDLNLFNAGDPFGTTAFNLNGGDSADNQDHVYSMVTTSSVLHPDRFPQFKSGWRTGSTARRCSTRPRARTTWSPRPTTRAGSG